MSRSQRKPQLKIQKPTHQIEVNIEYIDIDTVQLVIERQEELGHIHFDCLLKPSELVAIVDYINDRLGR